MLALRASVLLLTIDWVTASQAGIRGMKGTDNALLSTDSGVSQSIGVFSYNVQALPFKVGNTERLGAIADKIAGKPDWDILAFQEVFDQMSPEPRKNMINILGAKYPYYSPSTHSASDGEKESSGLLLMSKMHFLPLKHPENTDQTPIFTIPQEIEWLYKHKNGFHQQFLFMPFQQSTLFDSLAAKGMLVGLVDVTTKVVANAAPITEATISQYVATGFRGRYVMLVATTHCQSENTSQEPIATRRLQLVDMQKFLATTVLANAGPGGMYSNATFGALLLGDLNEDTYWVNRTSLPAFTSVLGNPTDVMATAMWASRTCTSPPCLNPSCDIPAQQRSSGDISFTALSALLQKGTSDWQQDCAYTCCLQVASSGSHFTTNFLSPPERLDYVLAYTSHSDPATTLFNSASYTAQGMYSQDWLLSDHIAISASIKVSH